MVDIDDMLKTNEMFKRKLKGLGDLSEYSSGKLGVYEDETYISWNYFQGLQRRFYGESIDSLIIFLNTTIQDYYIFYNMIIFFILLNNENKDNIEFKANYNLNDDIIDQLFKLQKENELFIKKIYSGLVILKFQYETNNDKRVSINALMIKMNELSTTYINDIF